LRVELILPRVSSHSTALSYRFIAIWKAPLQLLDEKHPSVSPAVHACCSNPLAHQLLRCHLIVEVDRVKQIQATLVGLKDPASLRTVQEGFSHGPFTSPARRSAEGCANLLDRQESRSRPLVGTSSIRVAFSSIMAFAALWRTKGEDDTLLRMAARPKLTPVQVLERLQLRLEKRMEALQRVKLAGFDMVIAELEVELDLLRRATRYLEEKN
jgi:hypothetical protein